MTTKRDIERRLEALEQETASEDDDEDETERLEFHFGVYMYEPEPQLTKALQELGFVVEREEKGTKDGEGGIILHTTPSATDVFGEVSWSRPGLTAVVGDIRIVWDDERREEVLANAEYPTAYGEATVPADPVVVDEGDGWKAVVPSDRVITRMVHRRNDAEYHGFEILGPVELPLQDAAEYDLVEVDADPDDDRHPNRPDI